MARKDASEHVAEGALLLANGRLKRVRISRHAEQQADLALAWSWGAHVEPRRSIARDPIRDPQSGRTAS